MSRYLAHDCERRKQEYLSRIDKALSEICKHYDEMDFENAREREIDMNDKRDAMKRVLNDAYDELSRLTFE